MEVYEKFMLSEEFVEEGHAGMNCFDCHDGVRGESSKEAAHAGFVADPSDTTASGNVC